jgi:hypothetical protein
VQSAEEQCARAIAEKETAYFQFETANRYVVSCLVQIAELEKKLAYLQELNK